MTIAIVIIVIVFIVFIFYLSIHHINGPMRNILINANPLIRFQHILLIQ